MLEMRKGMELLTSSRLSILREDYLRFARPLNSMVRESHEEKKDIGIEIDTFHSSYRKWDLHNHNPIFHDLLNNMA